MAAMTIALDHYRLSARYWRLLALLALFLAGGALSFFAMEHWGHAITGMSNHIVWGTPHVAAIFLIVAASGALNVASIASVFERVEYKPRAPLSVWLSIALLVSGLAILVLDLGQPGRLTVAMTHFNFTSIFAWNVFLYTGLLALAVFYLWTIYSPFGKPYAKAAGVAVFLWRLILTSGTGLIFGFLVGRDGYGSAMLAPTFIALSLAWGLALFLLTEAGLEAFAELVPLTDLQDRLRKLLIVFVAASLYFVVVHLMTLAYFERNSAFVRFLLLKGGQFTAVFWLGYVAIGNLLPLFWLLNKRNQPRRSMLLSSLAVVLGGIAFLYAFIIGGQAYPLQPFPGYEVVASGFDDGQVAAYIPSLPEIGLALGGFALAVTVILVGARVWPFVPRRDG
ncbi:NrfD/PsrC family molybdoenzyme membrane anchor subunit [Hydrogenophilus thiooxidans]|uniref:NrfD/PsrC family molybdoenzyme membrane anchor subunit n=1 Tax=Hydrogenophilus thiooxidans TaxID=2820326 RepID=UPI001C24DEA8|nr:NrfD/PsrC family molybdoenzyme membrane anchor subunit [Hydrogenophilus thiooxidans]